jgi:predicted transcriptional regulator
MSEAAFEQEILNRLTHMEKRMDYIMGYIEDSKLSNDDRKALRMALKEEKEGKLLTKKGIFG